MLGNMLGNINAHIHMLRYNYDFLYTHHVVLFKRLPFKLTAQYFFTDARNMFGEKKIFARMHIFTHTLSL